MPVPARSSTACSALIAVGGLVDLRHLLLRADQADPDHADAAGDRRPDPHDRRRRRREHRDLRARQGGDPRRAIDRCSGIATGYKRGFAAIVDANVVTFMTAFILFALATAEVKGFAFTLGIGTLVSLFTAVLATQAALGAMGRSRAGRAPRARSARRGAGARWTFDFMGASKWFFSLSGTILLIGALAIGGKGAELRHRLQVRHADPDGASCKPVSEAQVRAK